MELVVLSLGAHRVNDLAFLSSFRENEQASKSLDDDSELRKNGPKEDTPESDKAASAPDKIPVGMEAAKEAEERAARERAVQPLEVRVKRFREMLVEMQVSLEAGYSSPSIGKSTLG